MKIIRIIFFIMLALCGLNQCFALQRNGGLQRSRKVVGLVTDSVTGERLPFVNVFSKENKRGVLTDENGVFHITLPANSNVEVTALGYSGRIFSSGTGSPDTIRVMLSPKSRELEEVVIKPKKGKYSKKNNPALDLMRRVRAEKKLHDPEQRSWYSYDYYDKTILALNDFNTDLRSKTGRLSGKFKVLADFVDTAAWTGKRILNLTMKEKVSTHIGGSNAGNGREIVLAQKSGGVDAGVSQENVRVFLDDVLRHVDVYDNDITLLQNRFVSPLSAIAPDFYMYHITDTVMVGADKCVELSFAPHNPESMGFNGKLFIPVEDSVKYVRRLTMRVPKAINVNYLENLFISMNFKKDSLGYTHKDYDDIFVELKVLPGAPKLYGTRQTKYSNVSYDRRDDVPHAYESGLGNLFVLEDADGKGSDYWAENRMIPLSVAQSKMGNMAGNMRKVPLLYWTEKVLSVLVNGYIVTGNKSKFDIGPVNTFISHNTAEGMRFRVGGITTANLSKRFFARGYVAYGLKDRKMKYNGEIEYSFRDKKYHSREFPVNSIRATYEYDKDQLGQHYLFTNSDNVFLSIKRMKSDLITYRRLAKLEYNLELYNNLSFNITAKQETQEATPWVRFENADGTFDSRFHQSALRFEVRYAPGERFVQSASQRLAVNMDAPVFILSHEIGPKGLLGSDFTVNKTELSIQKRFWFSAFGYTDVLVKGGKIWSQVPFPLLLWQNANLSYTIQPESYSLLNPMEFAMDQYASLDITYFMNGALFNRIPLINKLKLREVFTFKGFMGSLSRKNNPEYNDNLYRFPTDANTVPMGKKPYMEIGAGIDNIFTILRVDYVWRLTYRDMPGIDKSGLRISLHFTF